MFAKVDGARSSDQKVSEGSGVGQGERLLAAL
jgi:hypothetical protein